MNPETQKKKRIVEKNASNKKKDTTGQEETNTVGKKLKSILSDILEE